MRLELVVLSALFCVIRGSVAYDDDVITLQHVFEKDRTLRSLLPDLIPDRILDIYAPASAAVQNQKCRDDSVKYKEGVRWQESWALQMFDSSSKVPEGLRMGNTVQLGNYDECLDLKDIPGRNGSFSGKHCVVDLSVPSKKQSGSVQEASNRLSLLKWSVCIPSSCSARDLENHLFSEFQGQVGVTLREADCNSQTDSTVFIPGDWVAIVLFGVVGITIVASTVYDVLTRNSGSQHSLMTCFSVFSNGRRLLDTSSSSEDKLGAIHGMRAITILWVLLGQTFYAHTLVPAINRDTIIVIKYDWSHLLIRNSELAPDTFLLLGGLLVCSVFMKAMDRGESFDILHYYLHGFIRLTPGFAAMILFSSTLFRHVDDGPLWGECVSSTEDCQDNWWLDLIYLNNYINVQHMCIGTSWFLAIYMHLYCLSPLVLYPLWRWPKVGAILLGVLFCCGLLTSFLVALLNELTIGDREITSASLLVFPTHTRFTPWLVGIALGYALHLTRNKTPPHSQFMVTCCFLGGAVLQFSSTLLLGVLQQPHHHYENWMYYLFISLNKPAWAIGVAWIVYACANGYAPPINALLSWKPFRVISRLAYGIYLVHMNVILWLFGTTRTPMYLHDRTIMMNFSAIMLISIGGAVVLHLAFEAPARNIETTLLQKHRAASKNIAEEP